MVHRSLRMGLGVSLALLLVAGLTACGDDGAKVRDGGAGSASASGSGSGAGGASGSGSGSGISKDAKGTGKDNPLVAEAVTQYTQYVRQQGEQIVTDAKTLTDAVRAGDLEAAKAAYAPSRQAWERIEPIAGLVEEVDGKVDARVDDFESVDDPEFTGWHRIEHLLFEKGDVAAAVPFADQLDRDLATLEKQLDKLEIPPVTIAVGAAELIEEVSGGKITGEEDRYSHTDLWDFAANVEGSEKAYGFLAPALRKKDEKLAKKIESGFADVKASLQPYREGDGWKPFSALTKDDSTRMKTELADLAEHLSQVAGTLGLE